MALNLKGRSPYLLVVASILILDRWTKTLVAEKFHLNESISVIDGFFSITYVRNTGVAFGIFSAISSPIKSALLPAFTGLAVILVVIYSLSTPVRNWLLQLALSLIVGGALGNLMDRLLYGYVIDFLEFYAGSFSWPSFNVADAAISTGVGLLLIEIIRNETPDRA
jgi:signal peptidase II